MLYDLKNIVDSSEAKINLRKYIEDGKKIELKVLSNRRTSKQNRALHKFYVIVTDVLNELGQEFRYSGLKGVELSTRYTPTIVKEFFWRPIQIALFDIESTRDLDTIKINEIADVMIKYFAEKGVHVDFPRKELE